MTTDKTPANLATVDTSYTTGHCAHNNRPGGCHLHNLQCGWPACDRRPAKPSLATVKHGGCVQLPTSERARFEAWAEGNNYEMEWTGLRYVEEATHDAWLAWQAALSAKKRCE